MIDGLLKIISLFSKLAEVSLEVKGLATIVRVNCKDKEGKKLCKKMKVGTDTLLSCLIEFCRS